MRYQLCLAIGLLFFFRSSTWCAAAAPLSITVQAGQSDVAEQVREIVSHDVRVERMTHLSDVYMQESEFEYLVGIRESSVVSANDVARGISYLLKKNKFQTITLTITPEGEGVHIHMNLVGFWTFAALKVHGIMLGKDAYRQYYLIEPGERFDEEKHEHSLRKIQEIFQAQGYFQGSVESHLEWDVVTKSITAHLTLSRGERFSVGALSLQLAHGACMQDDELARWHAKLYNRFLKRMSHTSYNKKQVNSQTAYLKRYLFDKGFIHVSIMLDERVDYQNKSVNLAFTIQFHRKKEFVFLGNHFFPTDQLRTHLEPFGRSAWLLPTSMVLQEVKELYHKKGFLEVSIDSREEKDRCFILISEGKRAAVKHVTLLQAHSFDERYLAHTFFSALTKKKIYDVVLFDACIDSLITFYVKQGYLDAKIISREFVPMPDNVGYSLMVTIDEGDPSYFAQVSVEGHEDFDHQGLFAQINNAPKPVIFDGQVLTMQRQWLLDHMHAQGYAYATVTPEFSRQGQLIRVVWKIQAGRKQVYFGKTVVVGSSTFPFEYIARELAYKEGDLFDKQLLKKSMLNLKELAVFDSIHLHPESVSMDEEKAIILKVQKDDPFELRVRAGFAAQQVSKSFRTAGLTYRAGGTFVVKNPFNYADRLLLEAEVTRSSRVTLFQYRRPWLFNYPIRAVFQGYSNRYEQPGLFGCVKNLYQVKQQGFLVGTVGTRSALEVSMNLGVEWMETTLPDKNSCSFELVDRLARAIDFAPRFLHKNIPYLLVEPTLVLDYVDNRLDPLHGFFTLFSLKGMVPLDRFIVDAYFVRFSIEHSWFVPIRSAVAAMRVRFGHIFHEHLKNIVPTERFYLGGANSIRSYETDRCPPLGLFIDDKGCAQYVPRGGKTLINLNGELRFPLFKDVRGAVFQDLGFLSGDFFRPKQDRTVLAGTGFGVRYTTPLGPVRFDMAWKWRRSHPDELPYAWFVTLGQAF